MKQDISSRSWPINNEHHQIEEEQGASNIPRCSLFVAALIEDDSNPYELEQQVHKESERGQEHGGRVNPDCPE